MIDREKVIKGLHCCSHTDGTNCGYCPYDIADEDCTAQMSMDVLDLLKSQQAEIEKQKEQEARVMTLDEVKAFDWDYCYLEEERLPGKEYRKICGNYALTCITWPCIASMRIQHGDDSYGKKWRCWSAKPTDEQRKAVKWE